MRCLNCDQELGGRFCSACGQSAETGRLTARSLIAPILEVLNWERGLVHTTLALATRPGATIEAYLAGRRVDYVSPVKFLVTTVSIALLTLWLVGPPDAGVPEGPSLQEEFSRVMDRYGNALLLATVPLFALATRLVFRARGRNYAEHLALNAYVFGQQNVFSLAVILLQRAAPPLAAPATAVYYVVCLGYFALVLKQTLARNVWSALATAITITAAVYFLFLLALTAILAM